MTGKTSESLTKHLKRSWSRLTKKGLNQRRRGEIAKSNRVALLQLWPGEDVIHVMACMIEISDWRPYRFEAFNYIRSVHLLAQHVEFTRYQTIGITFCNSMGRWDCEHCEISQSVQMYVLVSVICTVFLILWQIAKIRLWAAQFVGLTVIVHACWLQKDPFIHETGRTRPITAQSRQLIHSYASRHRPRKGKTKVKKSDTGNDLARKVDVQNDLDCKVLARASSRPTKDDVKPPVSIRLDPFHTSRVPSNQETDLVLHHCKSTPF